MQVNPTLKLAPGRILCLFVTSVLVACTSHPDYKPHRQSVPLFTEKGQIQVGLNASRGFGFQLAFAPDDHLGLIVQGNKYVAGEFFSEGEEEALVQLGVGRFKKAPNGIILETYLFGGLGGYSYVREPMFEIEEEARFSARVWTVAVQPALGYKTKQVEMALSSRLGYLGYANVQGFGTQDSLDVREYLKDHPHTLLFEPAATMRFFDRHFGVELQYGRSMSLTKPKLRQEDYWGSFAFLWRLPGEKIPPRD